MKYKDFYNHLFQESSLTIQNADSSIKNYIKKRGKDVEESGTFGIEIEFSIGDEFSLPRTVEEDIDTFDVWDNIIENGDVNVMSNFFEYLEIRLAENTLDKHNLKKLYFYIIMRFLHDAESEGLFDDILNDVDDGNVEDVQFFLDSLRNLIKKNGFSGNAYYYYEEVVKYREIATEGVVNGDIKFLSGAGQFLSKLRIFLLGDFINAIVGKNNFISYREFKFFVKDDNRIRYILSMSGADITNDVEKEIFVSELNNEDIKYELDNILDKLNNIIRPHRYKFELKHDGVQNGVHTFELVSDILKKSDYSMIVDFFESLKSLYARGLINFTANTSAHVHVGVGEYGKDFGIFDLLAMAEIIDEKSIQSAETPDRNFRQWAKLKSDYDIIETFDFDYYREKELTNETAYEKINSAQYEVRYKGYNIYSITEQPTVEFRYFSSRMLKDVKKYLDFINYFLYLPKFVKSKNRMFLDSTWYLTRTKRGVFISLDGYLPSGKLRNVDPVTEKDVINKKIDDKLAKKPDMSVLNKHLEKNKI